MAYISAFVEVTVERPQRRASNRIQSQNKRATFFGINLKMVFIDYLTDFCIFIKALDRLDASAKFPEF